jgi:hypothetical protein
VSRYSAACSQFKGTKRTDIPLNVSQIEPITQSSVYLTLKKADVGKLPTVPVKRCYSELLDQSVGVCQDLAEKNGQANQV